MKIIACIQYPTEMKIKNLHSLCVEQSIVVVTCFCIVLFWSHVTAVRVIGVIILDAFVPVITEPFVVLCLLGIILCRTFLSGRINMMYNWNEIKSRFFFCFLKNYIDLVRTLFKIQVLLCHAYMVAIVKCF